MRYEVLVKAKVLRASGKMPMLVQKRLRDLLNDLRDQGPWQHQWPNYSKLGPGKYHCHLNYDHVVCGTYDNATIIIEVYYAGSRENAPY